MNNSVKNPAANSAFNTLEFLQSNLAAAGININDHITYMFISLQELAADIDIVLREYLVNGAQNTGHIPVNMQQTMLTGMGRQRHFREIHRRQRSTVVAVHDELLRHFPPDVFLSFLSAATDVWRQQNIVQPTQRAEELVIVGTRLFREHINSGPQQLAGFYG